ncbi:MAG: hypothetical protein V7720_15735 [Halioglobus sp.]
MIKLVSVVATALALSILGACSTPAIDEQPAAEFAAEGLHPVSGTGFEAAYVLPEANLPSFSAVTFEAFRSADAEVTQTTVTGTNRRDWQMTAERQENLASAWSNATAHAFRDYPREESEIKRLLVKAELTRVSPGRSGSTSSAAVGSASSAMRDVVNVSAEFRLFDESSGQLLAVVRDRQTIGSLQWTRAAGVDTANLFNSWAALLHTRVSGR